MSAAEASAAGSPLTPAMHRAAELLARGWEQQRVASEIGVGSRTVRRWAAREDFAELVRQSRQRLLEENPTAESVLRSALHATRRSGEPDWSVRIAAARALLLPNAQREEAGAEPIRETRIYVPDPEPEQDTDDGAARPDLRTSPFLPEQEPQNPPESCRGRAGGPSDPPEDGDLSDAAAAVGRA